MLFDIYPPRGLAARVNWICRLCLCSLIVLAAAAISVHAAQYDVMGAIGKFERDSNLDGVADGWWHGAYGTIRYEASLVRARDGLAQSLTMSALPGDTGKARFAKALRTGDDGMMKAGDRITVAADMNYVIQASAVVIASANCATADWVTLSQHALEPLSSASPGTWRPYEATFIIPENTDLIVVEFGLASSSGWAFGKLALDEVTVTKYVDDIPDPQPVGAVRGALYFEPGRDVVWAAGRYSLFVETEGRAELMCTFREYRQDEIVLLYEMAGAVTEHDWKNDPIGYETIVADHPEWILLDADGEWVQISGWPQFWLLDVGDPVYQTMWTNNAIQRARATGADGVSIDNVGEVYYTESVPVKYPTQASWAAAMDSFVRYVVPRLKAAGLTVVANGPHWGCMNGYWAEWIQLVDGGSLEPGIWDESSPFPSLTDWENIRQTFVVYPDKILLLFIGSSPHDPRTREFMFASYLLWATPSSYAANNNADGHPYHHDSLMDIPIGLPNGECEHVAGHTYHREYEYGEVYVNADPNASEVVQIPPRLRDLEGNPVPEGPRVLQPRESLILLR